MCAKSPFQRMKQRNSSAHRNHPNTPRTEKLDYSSPLKTKAEGVGQLTCYESNANGVKKQTGRIGQRSSPIKTLPRRPHNGLFNSDQTMPAAEIFHSERLTFQRPTSADAETIFSTYANDSEVTRFLAWPRHLTVADTEAFLQFSDAEWTRWPAGPYLIRSRADGSLLGSTGFMFETPYRAMTGYVLARSAWGRGYASEALGTMSRLASKLGIRRLYAICHTQHRPSARVLEKCGFLHEGVLRAYQRFPNLGADEIFDVFCYALVIAHV